MLATFFVTSAHGNMLLITFVGISWAASNWIPYALLGDEISTSERSQDGQKKGGGGGDHDDRTTANAGLIYGIHGLSICFPQILMSLFMGALSMITGTRSALRHDVPIIWTFRAGGVFAFMACFYTTWIEDPEDFTESVDGSNCEEVVLGA